MLVVMDMLLHEKVLMPQAGRCADGPSGAKVAVRETLDMFDAGSENIMYGGIVESLLASQLRSPAAPYVPDLHFDEWAIELEQAVNQWNLEVEALYDSDSRTGDRSQEISVGVPRNEMDMESSDDDMFSI